MEVVNVMRELNNAMRDFLEVFPDEDTKAEAAECLYFAGGCIVNLLLDLPVVDYDLFITEAERGEALKEYFATHKVPQAFSVKARTENAVTLLHTPSGRVYQLVTRFTGPPDRVFTTFDFEHCKAYYMPTKVPAATAWSANEDIIRAKKLVYTGKKDVFTLNTMKRMCKFVARGWVPDNESILNLHRAIQNRPHIDTPAECAAQKVGFYGSSFT